MKGFPLLPALILSYSGQAKWPFTPPLAVANNIQIFAQILWPDQFNNTELIADIGNKYNIVLTGFPIESHVTALKAVDPSLKVIIFTNPYFGWGDRFWGTAEEMNLAIEDYGIRNSSNELMNYAGDGVSPLMDVTNEDWKDEFSTQLIKHINLCGADGGFIDTIEPDSISVPAIIPELPNGYTAPSWKTGSLDFVQHVLDELGSKELWTNTASRGPGVPLPILNQDIRDKPIAGETIEAFSKANPIDLNTASMEAYVNQTILTDLVTLSVDSPIMIETTGLTDNEALRIYALCGYLLGSNSNTYFYFTTVADHGINLIWREEWNASIGTPLNTAVLDGSGVYTRNFTAGRVVVNATDSTKIYSLGSGYIDWKGNSVNESLTVNAHSAHLLLKV